MSRSLWPALCLALLAILVAATVTVADGAAVRSPSRGRVGPSALQPVAAVAAAAAAASPAPTHDQAHGDSDVLLHLRSALSQRTRAKAAGSAEAEGRTDAAAQAAVAHPPAAYQSDFLWKGPGLDALRAAHALAIGVVAPVAVNGIVTIGSFQFILAPRTGAAATPLPVGHRELQRVLLVRGHVALKTALQAPGVGLATDPQHANSFVDAVYYADFRASRSAAAVGQLGRSAGLLIPAELGNHADFNRMAINFFVQSDRNYVHVEESRTARALQDVLAGNAAWPNCRVQIEIKLSYPTLPAAYDQPRYIPSGGLFRIVAPKPLCGDYVEVSRRLMAYHGLAVAAQATAAGPPMMAAYTRAHAWYLRATRKVNGQMVGWTAQTGLATEVPWNNPEPDRGDGYSYVTAAAAPSAWARAWLMASGPALTEARTRQGINNVGNQAWNPATPAVTHVTVGGALNLGAAGQGAFTYTLDPIFQRVTRASGQAWASDVSSDTLLGGRSICDTMFFADFRQVRNTLDNAHVGRTAGHIVAPSIAGPVTAGGVVAGAGIFNQHPVNFFPQAEISNSGATSTYNHMETGVQGFMTTVAGMVAAGDAAYANCHPLVTIDLHYGNLATSWRFIPTGGDYSVAIPMGACGGVATLNDLIVAIQGHPTPGGSVAANLERDRKQDALRWLHPLRARHDEKAADVAQKNAAAVAAAATLVTATNTWNAIARHAHTAKALQALKQANAASWQQLVSARQRVTSTQTAHTQAQTELEPLALALAAEAAQEAHHNIFATGFNARARDDAAGNLVKLVAWTNP